MQILLLFMATFHFERRVEVSVEYPTFNLKL